MRINSPKAEGPSQSSAGPMTYIHSGDQPVYAPNSKGGPVADAENGADLAWDVAGGGLGRYENPQHREDDGQRDALVENIVGHASAEVTPETQDKVVAYWANVDQEIGDRVAKGLDR